MPKECELLKLRRLQILGFKSFCDRTELKFHGDGVAAIIGPNGCGKSNIADAISWVLGEQSAKSLRCVRMEDVIFAGTRDRKPTGMAEVSLTLIDPQVYEGQVSGVPEIDIQDDMPPGEDDWDEASVRASAAEATEAHVAEVQPGPLDWKEGVEAAAEGETPEAGSEDAAEIAEDGTPAEAQAGAVEQQSASEEPQTASAESPSPTIEPDAQAAQNAANPVVLKIRRRKFKPMVFAK